MAVDQAQASGPTHTVWTFGDSAGTITTTAWFDTSSNQLKWTNRKFDPRGNVRSTTGETDSTLAAAPVYWRGLKQTVAGNLYQAGTTLYDPATGRYLSQATGDSNPYSLDHNRPTSPDPVRVPGLRVEDDGRTWFDNNILDPTF